MLLCNTLRASLFHRDISIVSISIIVTLLCYVAFMIVTNPSMSQYKELTISGIEFNVTL